MNVKLLLAALAALGFVAALTAEPLVKAGQTVAFMGDSITQQGAGSPSGYVRLIESGLAANGIDIKPIHAGISGHESDEMLARLERDVLAKKPDWMTLSCGVNDVWHQPRGGVKLPDYRKNITEIVDRCTQAGVKVLIMTSTPIKEQDNPLNQMLAEYNDFLKTLAKERGLPLADLNADMWAELNNPTQPRPKGNFLTADGVHMNPLGDMIMAAGVLRAFGLDDEQLAKARAEWQEKDVHVRVTGKVSVADYQRLSALAAANDTSVSDLLGKELSTAAQRLIQAKE